MAKSTLQNVLFRYAVGIVAMLAMLAIRWYTLPVLGTHYLLTGLIAPVAIAVWFGGTGPALVAMILGYVVAYFFFMEPGAGFFIGNLRDYFGVISYVIPCAIFIAFGRTMRQMAAALEAQAVELAETNRRKNQFIAVLSHELRNPLAPLVTDLEIIKMTGPTGVIAESVERMKRQVGHIIRMIDDLLDMSRITQDKVKLDLQRVDLVDLLNQCREMMHAQFDRMGHRLVLDLPEHAVYADIDPTRIAQAINNLLSNASKFTENGGQVRLSLGLEREQAVIRVQDNGHGIAPHQLTTIFEMFVQLDGSGERRTEGLGIGLSLAKQLVELHGGSIVAYSEGCGKGAEFVIRLPLPDDQKQAADARFPSNLSHAEVGNFWQRSDGYPHSMRAEYQGHAVSPPRGPQNKDRRWKPTINLWHCFKWDPPETLRK